MLSLRSPGMQSLWLILGQLVRRVRFRAFENVETRSMDVSKENWVTGIESSFR